MSLVVRLQDYLRHSASEAYQSVAVPPFTAFLHPTSVSPWSNYAIPDSAAHGNLAEPIAALQAVFRDRGRQPRLEYIEEFAPELGPALRAAGLYETDRLQLMACTPETARPAATVPGLSIVMFGADGALSDALDLVTAQRQGFEPGHAPTVTEADTRQFLERLGTGRAVLGRVDDEPAGAAVFTRPFAGVTELVGIATPLAFRGRGIASALTAAATQAAFAQGVELVCLSAANAQAGRVYERVGFQPVATTLFYLAPGDD
jgi:ribosomal protein S18 acetylase RimI-like enzyme